MQVCEQPSRKKLKYEKSVSLKCFIRFTRIHAPIVVGKKEGRISLSLSHTHTHTQTTHTTHTHTTQTPELAQESRTLHRVIALPHSRPILSPGKRMLPIHKKNKNKKIKHSYCPHLFNELSPRKRMPPIHCCRHLEHAEYII